MSLIPRLRCDGAIEHCHRGERAPAAVDRKVEGGGWSEDGKGAGEGVMEDERDRKCNSIPSKRESLSPLKQKAVDRSALDILQRANGPRQTLPLKATVGIQTFCQNNFRQASDLETIQNQ